MGQKPETKIIQATHTAELAVGFGRKVKNLIDSEVYRDVFPELALAKDAKASGRWSTDKGGEYYAVGVGGALAGRGANLCIIDDPVSEQDALSPTALDNIYEWYTSGPRQRLQPGGAIIIVMTRWSIRDLTAKVLQKQAEGGADKWEVVEFPAIFPDTDKVLWPEFWSREELDGVRASIPVAKWNAQYLQNPTAEEGAIVKRDWWNVWDSDEPPTCSYIIQSYDTAFTKSERSDYSAITTWGVFHPDDGDEAAIILLDAEKGRWEFPELKDAALRLYGEYEPDLVLIEQKASGTPLTQDLRKMGIPVSGFTPGRGADKFSRMNACAPVFESGMVYAPEARWAEEVIEECAAFPNGEHDDLADSMSQAILRFRQGNFIRTRSDEEDEDFYNYRSKREYY
jgi:predicted phage terminase large subunit-like protein